MNVSRSKLGTDLATPLAPWASGVAGWRLAELTGAHLESSTSEVLAAVDAATSKQMSKVFKVGLGLYAGSNVMSPSVLNAHRSELSSRPALGWPGEKLQPAVEGIEELEIIAAQQLRRAFQAKFAEARFLTATMANLAAFSVFTKPGDTVAILAPEAGSHASHQEHGTAGVRGVKTAYLPYDSGIMDLDHGRLRKFMVARRPAMVVVGGSVIQFPMELGPLRHAADLVGARVVFDASHVAGLIAAGVFPNPLDAGVDLMTFSTYKTLAGPAGAAAVTNDPVVAEQVSHALHPVLSSNYDAARLGPVAVATAEAIEQHPAWAMTTVDLAVEIARSLQTLGHNVQGESRGFTATHQVVVDVADFGGGAAVMRRLEAQDVQVGACRTLSQPEGMEPAGIRIGTQEIVRLGAVMEHAQRVAMLIDAVIRQTSVTAVESAQEIRDSFGPDIWGRAY